MKNKNALTSAENHVELLQLFTHSRPFLPPSSSPYLLTQRLQVQSFQLLGHLSPPVAEPAIEVGRLEEMPSKAEEKHEVMLSDEVHFHVTHFAFSFQLFGLVLLVMNTQQQ